MIKNIKLLKLSVAFAILLSAGQTQCSILTSFGRLVRKTTICSLAFLQAIQIAKDVDEKTRNENGTFDPEKIKQYCQGKKDRFSTIFQGSSQKFNKFVENFSKFDNSKVKESSEVK